MPRNIKATVTETITVSKEIIITVPDNADDFTVEQEVRSKFSSSLNNALGLSGVELDDSQGMEIKIIADFDFDDDGPYQFGWEHIRSDGRTVGYNLLFDPNADKILFAHRDDAKPVTADELAEIQESLLQNIDMAGGWTDFKSDMNFDGDRTTELLVSIPGTTNKVDERVRQLEEKVGKSADSVDCIGNGVDVLFAFKSSQEAYDAETKAESCKFVEYTIVKMPG